MSLISEPGLDLRPELDIVRSRVKHKPPQALLCWCAGGLVSALVLLVLICGSWAADDHGAAAAPGSG